MPFWTMDESLKIFWYFKLYIPKKIVLNTFFIITINYSVYDVINYNWLWFYVIWNEIMLTL